MNTELVAIAMSASIAPKRDPDESWICLVSRVLQLGGGSPLEPHRRALVVPALVPLAPLHTSSLRSLAVQIVDVQLRVHRAGVEQ
jgi:hypothetical protein